MVSEKKYFEVDLFIPNIGHGINLGHTIQIPRTKFRSPNPLLLNT